MDYIYLLNQKQVRLLSRNHSSFLFLKIEIAYDPEKDEENQYQSKINAETSDVIRKLCVLQKVYEIGESLQNVWTPKLS
jgi:hypothetical protein